MTVKTMMTTRELASALNVSPKHIWNLQKKHTIPSFKVGRVHRFNLESVLRCLANESPKQR